MSEQNEQDRPEGAISEENLVQPAPEVEEHKDDENDNDEDDDESDNPLTEVALAVLRGEYGTGQEQRLNLSKAGFNHREVNKEVSRLRNNL